jgi:hypothetical protein
VAKIRKEKTAFIVAIPNGSKLNWRSFMFFGLVLLIGTCGGGVILMNVCVMCHHQTQFDAALVLIGLGFPLIIFEKMMMSVTYRRYDAISVDFHTYQFFQKMKPLIARFTPYRYS